MRVKVMAAGLAVALLWIGSALAQVPGSTNPVTVTACGTAPTTRVAGGNYPPTMDVNGNTCVGDAGGGGTIAANITQWASGVLGAMANYGTSPGAVLVPGVNAFITNVVSTLVSPSASSAAGIAPVVAGSAVSSSVLKASAGNLYGVYATCTSACWLMVFNATSAPGNGSTTAGIAASGLQDCIPIPAGGSGSINYSPGPPEVFSTGITAAISSTACATLTLSTVGYIHGSAQ